MLPDVVKDALIKNKNFCFPSRISGDTDELVVREKDRERFHEQLGIADRESAFVDFYTIVAAPPVGQGDELLPLQDIKEISRREEFPELDGIRDFFRISSIEGEGSYYYNRKTDAVYDANWGQEEDMVSGRLEPKFKSFADFLEWYYA